MNKRKRLLALFVVFALAGTLSACSGSSSTSSDADASSTAASDAESTVSEESTLSEPETTSAEQTSSADKAASTGQASSRKQAASTAQTASKTQAAANNQSGAKTNKTLKQVMSSIPKNLKNSTIKYFMWYDGKKETEGPAISKFQLESGIKVDVEVGAYDNFSSLLARKISSGAAPDVIRTQGNGIDLIKLSQPLENTKFDFNDSAWDEQIMQAYTFNGKTYGTNLKNSVYFDANVIWYNTQTLSDYGCDDPYTLWKQKKWTWDKLWEMCRTAVEQGCKYGAALQPVNAYSIAQGVDFIDLENGKYINSVNDSKRLAKLVSAWTELLKQEKNKLISPDTWMMDDFTSGRTAFFSTSISSGFNKRSYFEQFKKRGELKCVPFPDNVSGTTYTLMSELSAWCIPTGAKNKESVPYFLRYMLDEQNYDLQEVFCNQSVVDVFRTLRASKNPRYKSVVDSTLTQADNGTTRFIIMAHLFNGEAGQITSTLRSFAGNVQDAVDKANAQIAKLGK